MQIIKIRGLEDIIFHLLILYSALIPFMRDLMEFPIFNTKLFPHSSHVINLLNMLISNNRSRTTLVLSLRRSGNGAEASDWVGNKGKI